MAKADDSTLDLGSWCILRMASLDTLKVSRFLGAMGLEVWTPIEKRFGRMPRTRAKFDKEFALLPSYVFGHVRHMDELLKLAMVPVQGLPRFSMFQHGGGIPLIADDQLDALRGEENRVTRIFERLKNRGRKGPNLAPGSVVRLPEGPFAGINGVVREVQGQYTVVDFTIFGRLSEVKVASLLLAEDVPAENAKAA